MILSCICRKNTFWRKAVMTLTIARALSSPEVCSLRVIYACLYLASRSQQPISTGTWARQVWREQVRKRDAVITATCCWQSQPRSFSLTLPPLPLLPFRFPAGPQRLFLFFLCRSLWGFRTCLCKWGAAFLAARGTCGVAIKASVLCLWHRELRWVTVAERQIITAAYEDVSVQCRH